MDVYQKRQGLAVVIAAKFDTEKLQKTCFVFLVEENNSLAKIWRNGAHSLIYMLFSFPPPPSLQNVTCSRKQSLQKNFWKARKLLHVTSATCNIWVARNRRHNKIHRMTLWGSFLPYIYAHICIKQDCL